MIVAHSLKLILIRIPSAGYGDIATAVSRLPGSEIITHPVFGDHFKMSDLDADKGKFQCQKAVDVHDGIPQTEDDAPVILPDYRKVAFIRNPVTWVTESWFYCTTHSTSWAKWGTEECDLRGFVGTCFMQMDWVDPSVDVYPIEDRDRVSVGWKIGVPPKWQDTRQWDHPIDDKIVNLINERLAS